MLNGLWIELMTLGILVEIGCSLTLMRGMICVELLSYRVMLVSKVRLAYLLV